MGEPMIDQDEPLRPKHVAFKIEVDKNTGTVFGILVAAEGPMKFTRSIVDQALLKAGVFHWAKDGRVINILINNFSRKKPCQLMIATRKNATFKVTLSSDNMAAYIDVDPAQGGVGLTVEDLTNELVANLVASDRIDIESLEEVTSAAEPEQFTVATGRLAVQGTDTQFKSLVEEHNYAPVEILEDKYGSIDHWTGKKYVTVLPQAPIMERTPPQLGIDGYDIFGQGLPSVPGKEIPWGKKMRGTSFDPDNPEILISEVAGHPVFFRNGGRVDASLEFDNVDLTTGHITFDGSVFIKGDVRTDMEVNATGDIFVSGVVERARIKAGNNITVLGGVVGDSQVEVPDGGLPAYECFLEAFGSITAKYVNLAWLSAGDDIIVREYVFNSKLKSGDKVEIGQGGGKGRLVGGETHAVESVIVKTMGSEAYNITKVFLGSSKTILDSLDKLNFIREQRVSRERVLRGLLPPAEAEGGDPIQYSEEELTRIQRIKVTLRKLKDDTNEIDRRRKQAILGDQDGPQPTISATSACFPNCYLNINGVRERVSTEHRAIAYVKKFSKIAVRA